MTIARRTFLAGVAAGVAAGAAASPSAAADADVAALYAAAKKEGTVSWLVSPYAIPVYTDLVTAFKAKYPGVDVQMNRLTAEPAYQRVAQDLQSGVREVDVFNSSDASHYVELKKRNALMPFVPPDIGSVPKAFAHLDPDNTFVLGSLGLVAIDYNAKRVSPAPKVWKDLLDPRFKDQLSLGNPGFSSYVGIWAFAIQQMYGWDYLKAMAALNPKMGRSILDVVTDVISGERIAGPSDAAFALQQKAAGNPVEVAFPQDGSILITSPVAILRDAPHPNAGKLLLNFYYSKEYQAVLVKTGNIPLRSDTPWVNGLSVDKIKSKTIPIPELVAGVPDVIARWRQTFGV